MTKAKSLLAIFAHPEDGFTSASGTLATYAASDVEVNLICATRGERGRISDPSLAFPDNLGAVREEELRESCRIMGIHQPHILGYHDSGMTGTKDSQNRRCLHMANPEEAVGKLVKIIRQLQPEVIITFDQQGEHNPDHLAISRYSTRAFQASGDHTMYPEQLTGSTEPYSPHRLFYIAIPHSRVEALAKAIPEEDLPDDQEIKPEDIGTADDNVTVAMNIANMYQTKRNAIASHRTQQRPTDFFNRLPENLARQFFSIEYFLQALPKIDPSTRYSDLFEGL